MRRSRIVRRVDTSQIPVFPDYDIVLHAIFHTHVNLIKPHFRSLLAQPKFTISLNRSMAQDG
jgi:hypothetical protein